MDDSELYRQARDRMDSGDLAGAFEVAIPDADAAVLDTPGKLVDYLCIPYFKVSVPSRLSRALAG